MPRIKGVPFFLFIVGAAALRITVSLIKSKKKVKEKGAKEVMLLLLKQMQQMPFIFDGKQKVEEAISELRVMVGFLRDKVLAEGSRVNYFLCDVVEMAHDVVDLHDALNFNNSNHQDNFDAEICSIRIWIQEASTRVVQYINETETESVMRSENVGEGDDEDVVDLGEDVKLLLRKLIFNKHRGLWISLVGGIVGCGKTILARQVYNQASVIDWFDCRAWVSVSSKLTHKEVLMKLIQQVVDGGELERDSLLKEMDRADNASLQQMLHRCLQGKRYLIVLDGLPKEMRLKCFLKGLPHEEGKGSRLLLTSSSASMNIRKTIHDMHVIKTLNPDKSWKLFLKTISKFTSEGIFPKHLEKKGREVLTKCGGLPLAIKDVGRQVAEKRQSGCEWEQLLESIDFGSTSELLEPCYHKLNPIEKLCFLHLAFFKENASTKVEKLVEIWAAAGIGSESICYLLFRSLLYDFIIEAMDYEDRVKSCRINAMLHRLSIKKAEEKGFEILRNNGINRPSKSPDHLVVICSREKFNYSMNQDKHIVSLTFHGGGYFDASQFYWKSLELLKILDLDDFGVEILPESIGSLMELKYLGLRNNHIQELPNVLGCLKKLEVLDIAQNFMMEVPDIIWEMSCLRHLYMCDVICRKPLKIDALQNLVTLTYISIDNWTYELSGLQMMTNLNKLGIIELDENSDLGKLFTSLAELEKLSCLMLRGFRFRSMPCLHKLCFPRHLTHLTLDGLLPKLPTANNFPPNIRCLKLINTRLDEDPMTVLEKLPKLFYLLLRNAYIGQQIVILQDSFPMLRLLSIEELWNLRNVQIDKGAIPDLKVLRIINCPYLETLPEEIGSMNFLKLDMVTTKNNATKINNSTLISEVRDVEINA